MAVSRWHQFELSAVKENPCSIVCKGTESSCLGLDRLDAAVEAFAHGIGNAVAKVGERVFECFLSILATLMIGLSWLRAAQPYH